MNLNPNIEASPKLAQGFNSADGHAIGLQDLVRIFAGTWPRILIIATLTALIAGAISFSMTRTFTARASVIYDPTSSINLSPSSRWLEPSLETNIRMESQVVVIRSASVAEIVIEKLGLVGDPELTAKPSRFRRMPNSVVTGILEFFVEKPPAANESNAGAGTSRSAEPTLQGTVPLFLKNLSVRRLGRSTVIEIEFTSSDAKKAVQIANAVAEAYIAFDLQNKSRALRRGSTWLQARLEDLRKQSFDALLEVERFKRTAGRGPISDATVKLAELESTAETYKRMYETVHLQLMDTTQKISYPVADARTLSLASISRLSIWPRTRLIVLLALVLGAFLGAIVSFARLSQDGLVRTREDVVRSRLAFLGNLRSRPSGWMQWVGLAPIRGRASVNQSASSVNVSNNLNKLQLKLAKPLNRFVQTSRLCVGVSDLSHGGNSTLVAIMLARYFAKQNLKTLLVDAHFSDRLGSEVLAPDAGKGFADLLAAPSDYPELKDLVSVSSAGRFDVLPTGRLPSNQDADKRWEANNYPAAVERLRNHYDVCVFDMEPQILGHRTQKIGNYLDHIVFVAETGTVNNRDLDHYQARFSGQDVNVMGLITAQAPLPRLQRSPEQDSVPAEEVSLTAAGS